MNTEMHADLRISIFPSRYRPGGAALVTDGLILPQQTVRKQHQSRYND
jgi:hypothetical protein